jgi:hypothetical protein
MRRVIWIPLTIAAVAAALAVALPALAARPAHADAARHAHQAAAATASVVLINEPVAKVCLGQTFTVGVWYQQNPGSGSRAYRVAVESPRGTTVLSKHGLAPTKQWAFWKVRATHAGTYRTTYSAHWKSASKWTDYRVTTRARAC